MCWLAIHRVVTIQKNLEGVRDFCKDAGSTSQRLALTLGAEMCRILYKGNNVTGR